MSGIYIKGMEMPKKGEYRITLYVCDDGYAYMDVDLFPVDKDRFEAVPAPPHGRLIDADELCTRLFSAWDTANGEKKTMISAVMADVVTPIVVGTSTIIPAEEEES